MNEENYNQVNSTYIFFTRTAKGILKENKEWMILILLLYQKNSKLIKNEIKKTGNRTP